MANPPFHGDFAAWWWSRSRDPLQPTALERPQFMVDPNRELPREKTSNRRHDIPTTGPIFWVNICHTFDTTCMVKSSRNTTVFIWGGS